MDGLQPTFDISGNNNGMQSMLNTILAHLPTTSSGGTASR